MGTSNSGWKGRWVQGRQAGWIEVPALIANIFVVATNGTNKTKQDRLAWPLCSLLNEMSMGTAWVVLWAQYGNKYDFKNVL